MTGQTCVELPRCSCGRVDDHAPHRWRRPLVLRAGRLLLPRRYWCPGPGVREGGAR